MKKLLLLFIACTPVLAFTQPTRTTVQNGNALNPFTWDCTCIPALTDNIVVNHALNLDVDYYATSGSLTINASGSITGSTPTRFIGVAGSTFLNNGTVSVGDIYHSAGSFTNNGTLTATNLFGTDQNAITYNYGTFNVNDTMGVDTTAQFRNYGYATVLTMLNAGVTTNYLSYSGGDVWNSGTFNNQGGGGTNIANLYTDGTFSNTALLTVNASLYNSNNFTNGHQIVISADLLNGDTINGTATFTNNGIVSVASDLLNSETINGTGGKFCVQAQTSNSGAISGTIDICDLTGGAIDLNVGTVAGSVTFCSNSCSVGVIEKNLNEVSVYPNPFENHLTIETGETNTVQCWLHDMQGRLVQTGTLRGKITWNIPGTQSGTYVLTVRFADGSQQHTLVTK